MKKIVYYVNQFYGQIGGEEAADQTPIVKEGSVGRAVAMQEALKDIGALSQRSFVVIIISRIIRMKLWKRY